MPVFQSDIQVVLSTLMVVLIGLIPLVGRYMTIKMEQAIQRLQTQQTDYHTETKGVLQTRNDLLGELVEKVNGNPLTITIKKEADDGAGLHSTGSADVPGIAT